jgi:thiol:disulfide interchange protein
MNLRQRLVFAVAVCAALGLVGAYKLGPRYYNRYRLHQLQGRQVYDVHADAPALFAAGLAQAKREHKRLLVVLGGNWCQWCLALDDLMHRDAELSEYVSSHFVVLKLDSQAAHALDDAWGHPTRQGVPVMIFVDDTGALKHVQETVSLELWKGKLLGHDPGRIMRVLKSWS